MLNVNVTGVELQKGGADYLNAQLAKQNIKFQLLGKDECDNIESIIYQNKVCNCVYLQVSFFSCGQLIERKNYFEILKKQRNQANFQIFS